MRLLLNARLDELDDPHGVCQDISGRDHWGIGNSETQEVKKGEQLDVLLPLVCQAFERKADGV